MSRILFAFAAAVIAVGAEDAGCTADCNTGPCTKSAKCIEGECYFAFVEDGTACNDGANTCEGGSCSGASSYISRRSVGTKPSIGVDEGKVVIHAIDTVFAVPEQRVGDEIIPASSFSMVDFKASIDTSIAEVATTTDGKLEELDLRLTNAVDSKLATVTEQIEAVDSAVKNDVKTSLDKVAGDLTALEASVKEDVGNSLDDLEAKITGLKTEIANTPINIIGVEMVKAVTPSLLELEAGGGQHISFNGNGFTKDTKVKFKVGSNSEVSAAKVQVGNHGLQLVATTPKIDNSKSDPCVGGDGKALDVTVKVYGKGDKFFSVDAQIPGTNEFGNGMNGDMTVISVEEWNKRPWNKAYMVNLGDSNLRAKFTKLVTYHNVDTSVFKCGTKVLIMNMGNMGRNQAEKVGAYSFATVKSASGKSVTFQAEVQVPVNNHNVQPNGPRVIMQVVPQFKHVSFLGGGQFKAAVMDYETKSYDTTNNLQTGIVAFFAHKVSINGASPAVSADKVGFKGGVSRGVKAQDAKSTSISGGNNGEKGTGSGHNRRGGHGGKGCTRKGSLGKGGRGGDSGGGWTASDRAGGGGGGSDYSDTGAGGGGADCSGQHYSTASGHGKSWFDGGYTITQGGGAATGAGGGASGYYNGAKGGYSNGNRGCYSRCGGYGGSGSRGGGIIIIAVEEFEAGSSPVFASAVGGKGGGGGGGGGHGHKDAGGGGGSGAQGAAGGSVIIRNKDGRVSNAHITAAGGAGGGGGGGAGVPNQHRPSASGGGGGGAGRGGGGGAGGSGNSYGGTGGNGGSDTSEPTKGSHNSAGAPHGGGGGCDQNAGCRGRGGGANEGGRSSSTSCVRVTGKNAKGLDGGDGGEATTSCGADGNQGGGGGGGASGAPGQSGLSKIIV